MKKLAIGCLVVAVLACIVVGGVVYYAYTRVQSTLAQFGELSQIPEIESGIRARDSYTPPASDELTERQLEQLLRVQTLLRERIGVRFADFEKKYKTLSQKEEATIMDVPTLIAGYRDLAAGWVDAKRAQVAALNEVGLSLEEYRWIREQAYRALGMAYVDLDIGAIAEDIRKGATTPGERGQLRGSIGPAGPESNRKLVEPFKQQLEANIALASFGL
jgi:hypothetical protein